MRGILSLVFFGVLLFYTKSLINAIIAYILVWLFVFLFYECKQLKTSFFSKPDKNHMILLLKLGLPLGFVLFLISINSNVQKYILSYYLDVTNVGYFSAIAYLTIVGNILINGIGQAVSPRIARLLAGKQVMELKKLLSKLNLLALIVGIVGIILSELLGAQILTLFYNDDYAQFTYLLVLIVISAMFNFMSTFTGYALTAARIVKAQPVLYSIVLVSEDFRAYYSFQDLVYWVLDIQ